MAIHKIRTKVVGVTFDNADGVNRQKLIELCSVGDDLLLVHDTENEQDSCAVAVVRVRNFLWMTYMDQIGYIGRHLSPRIVEHLDKESPVTAKIIDLTGNGGSWWGKTLRGVNIEITLD